MKNIVIIGATSAIAQSVGRLFAAEKANLFLVARDSQKLAAVIDDLRVRGAEKIGDYILDLNKLEQHQHLLESAQNFLGKIDCVLIAHGTLSNQAECESSFQKFQSEFMTNFTSVASLLTLLANIMASQRSGSIAVISSVAGDRGRQSNYVYGTAKGALSIMLQGLRNRLQSSGVHVLTIKPGFTDTPMTSELKKGALWAKPEEVARDIHLAIKNKKDILYTPWFWRYIMLIIRHVPEFIFKKMKL